MANFKNISFIFLLRFGHVIIDIYWMFNLEYWSYMTFLCFLMITIERWLPTIETVSYHFLCSFFVLRCKSFISFLIPIIFTCTISFFLTYGLWVAKEIFIGIIRYLTKTTHNTNYLYDLFIKISFFILLVSNDSVLIIQKLQKKYNYYQFPIYLTCFPNNFSSH